MSGEAEPFGMGGRMQMQMILKPEDLCSQSLIDSGFCQTYFP